MKSILPPPKATPYRYRAIPEPGKDAQELLQTVSALKEVVETLIGQRGDGGKVLTTSGVDEHIRPGTLIRDDHLDWTPPFGTENPHPQYWHRVLDTAGVSFYLSTPQAGAAGSPIGPWDGYTVNPYGLTVDLATGRVHFDGTDSSNGVYVFSVYMEITSTQSSNFVFGYFDSQGNSANLSFLVDLGVQQTVGIVSWTHLATIDITTPGWFELRCVSATAPFTVTSARTSAHRVAARVSGLQASQSGMHV
jgi:hypothetical protein